MTRELESKYFANIEKIRKNDSHGIILSQIAPGSAVLECGCAAGCMTRYMKETLDARVSIVERNPSDYDRARAYAADGICTDLESREWWDYYQGRKFDYILFADNLEHLRDPESVLNRAADLLKEDGTVIASIPNVAHADILVNLLNGRWNYTPRGLLGSTHIHFWAEKNLDGLFRQAGLTVVEQDYTILSPFTTEQKSEETISGLLPAIYTLCHRPFADVYQFVFSAKKADYVRETGIVCTDHYTERHAAYWTEPPCCSEYLEAQNQLASQHEEREALIRLQKRQLDQLIEQSRTQEGTIRDQQAHIVQLEAQNRYLSERVDTVSNASFGKITKPARFILDVVKWAARPHAEKGLIRKGLYSLRTNGLRVTWQKARQKISFGDSFAQVANQALFTEEELARQRNHRFSKEVSFSIVVPLYNTPESFLREMIESVLAQTYADWELCMADGSDVKHGDVARICREYAEKDNRIHYRKLEKNLGISGNTNACLEMARGDYIGLLDHDDLLHPAALYEVMRTIENTGADFVYTDEAVFVSPDIKKISNVQFKPDFAPDNLRAKNYICHFTVFHKELLNKAGQFDPACDGSQDHDMMLRLTEKAQRVAHIPEILYYWRAHAGSVAQDISSKQYAAEAGIRAVKSQLSRSGYSAEVYSSKVFPAIYQIQYAIHTRPRISILIPVLYARQAEACVNDVLHKTTYPDYEIILGVPNDEKQFQIQEKHVPVRICLCPGTGTKAACLNRAVLEAQGQYLVFLDERARIVTGDWLEQMLMYAQRPDVGAVGAKLFDEKGRIHSAGLILGAGEAHFAGSPFTGESGEAIGYMGKLWYAQNCSAVSGACMMVDAAVFHDLGRMDETLEAYDDVDFCLKLRRSGLLIVWTPYAQLRLCIKRGRKAEKVPAVLWTRWREELTAGDPYYNPNFQLGLDSYAPKPSLSQHDAR